MSWTDERVEQLKTMWNEGKSASQIAKTLGGVTRNAVIGKVHRLGLSNRANGGPVKEEARAAQPEAEPVEEAPVTEEMEAPEPAPQPDAAEEAGEPTAEPAREVAGRTAQPTPPTPAQVPAASEVNAEALASLAEIERRARKLTLMQLTERTCKWPIGDPATEEFWFCGLPAEAGKPYCEAHVTIAFQPMSSRRDRRAGGR